MLWCVSCPALADYGVSHALPWYALAILLVSSGWLWYPACILLVSCWYPLVCLMVCYGYALLCLVSLINSLVSQLKGIDTMTQSAYNQGVTRCQNLVSKRLNEKERKDNDLWLC